MFRKSVLAIAAVATIAGAALVPTTASAHGFKGNWGWWGGYWGFRPAIVLSAPVVYSYSPCGWRLIPTKYGNYVRVWGCAY